MDLADKLMQMAARRSVETQFGWAHPDCETLQEAARVLRGEPVTNPITIVEGVLSARNQNALAAQPSCLVPPYPQTGYVGASTYTIDGKKCVD